MMCSYTTINQTAMCESAEWQERWARAKLGFQGNIVTDCTALSMPAPSSEATMDAAHNAAKAIGAGTDLNCGDGWDGKAHGYTATAEALSRGLVSLAQLDTIVGRSLGLRMRAGLFDPVEEQGYTKIPVEMLGATEHHALAEDVAAQGLGLLKNPPLSLPLASNAAGVAQGANTLPLARGKRTAVGGPHAHAERQLLGSYFTMACPLPRECPRVDHGCPLGSADLPCVDGSGYCMLDWSCTTSPFGAIDSVGGGLTTSAIGCSDGVACTNTSLFAEALATAQGAEQLVIMLGLSANIESEGKDRTSTTLPGMQEELAMQLLALKKPTVVVLLNGGIVSVDRLAASSASCAIVEAWYPGIQGAQALAKALFGVTNKWGKLPVTVYDSSFSDSVQMVDMSMTSGLGRTYKYWLGPPPLFPFGHGLSLTTFALHWRGARQPTPVKVSSSSATLTLEIVVNNTGTREGDEVVMVYHVPRSVQRPPLETIRLPHRRLVDFERVSLAANAAAYLTFQLNTSCLGLVDSEGNTYLYPGAHELRLDRGHGDELALQVSVATSGPVLLDMLL